MRKGLQPRLSDAPSLHLVEATAGTPAKLRTATAFAARSVRLQERPHLSTTRSVYHLKVWMFLAALSLRGCKTRSRVCKFSFCQEHLRDQSQNGGACEGAPT